MVIAKIGMLYVRRVQVGIRRPGYEIVTGSSVSNSYLSEEGAPMHRYCECCCTRSPRDTDTRTHRKGALLGSRARRRLRQSQGQGTRPIHEVASAGLPPSLYLSFFTTHTTEKCTHLELWWWLSSPTPYPHHRTERQNL